MHALMFMASQRDSAPCRHEAEPVRSGLLYGSGTELVAAVAVVLRAAGFTVTDLDEELGTQSADPLAVLNGSTCLVEVKAAAGAAGEKMVSQLRGHLETWSELRPNQLVTGAALIVNHQHRLDPAERTAEVYQRNGPRRHPPFSRTRLRRPVPLVVRAGLARSAGRGTRPGASRRRTR
ncbi:hypothetical protein ACIRQF_30905 [Streptomyces sp. NPDC101191]|uniref:hypothetical protein n=1 Tax=Streptomyces sp. NPDC101191 TaxID=3366126 RepID=UPI00380F49BA